jgi:hypothetical protein
LNVDASLTEARSDLVGKKRELVRPDARGDSEQQDSARKRHGLGLVGDSSPDRVAPNAVFDGRAQTRKSILSGTKEDRLEALWSHRLAPPSR